MAKDYVETHKVNIKGFLNFEDEIIEREDSTPVTFEDLFQKFNGAKVSLTIQLTNDLD